MGLKEFWQKLTGGDSAERELEEVRDNPDEVPTSPRTTRA